MTVPYDPGPGTSRAESAIPMTGAPSMPAAPEDEQGIVTRQDFAAFHLRRELQAARQETADLRALVESLRSDVGQLWSHVFRPPEPKDSSSRLAEVLIGLGIAAVALFITIYLFTRST